jgi:hypothetical protein
MSICVENESRKRGRRPNVTESWRANLLLRSDQQRRLAELADRQGLSVSATVRQLIDVALAAGPEGR